MKTTLPPILVVDDEKNMRLSLATMLGDEGYSVEAVESAEAGLTQLARGEHFMVITDARLGGMSGYEFLGRVRGQKPDLPILMITAFATPKLAVEAIKAGAIDYVAKPFAPEELLHAVARCAERYRLLQENAGLRVRAGEIYRLEDIVGDSPLIQELRQLIQTVAPTDARVLILGESGTGKELVAGALHTLSGRKPGSYVRINCAAIPETLLESELFGHEKGAFTGALRQKQGRVEEADGGTIFLDEIADMSRPLQAKLLRFLEDGSFTRVGGTQELHVNVRLLAATNRDIVQSIREGQFREDLFHRLNVVQFRLPPLRDRGEDAVLLGEHFLAHFNAGMNKHVKDISRPARQKLLSHHWPGNVRELKNVIERALILEKSDAILPGSLPDFQLEAQLHKSPAPRVIGNESLDELLAGFERELIGEMLERNHFSLTKTAEQLKLSRHALRYRMQRLNISITDDDDDRVSAGKDRPYMNSSPLATATPTLLGIEAVFEARWFFDPAILVVLLLCLLFAGAVFLWAAVIRKRRPPSGYRHHRSPTPAPRKPAEKSRWRRLFSRKRRHRRGRSRNPTLAETGGLPPLRAEEPPETGT